MKIAIDQTYSDLKRVELVLPMPPSVNVCYTNVRKVGRVKTKLYKQWEEEAQWVMKTHKYLGQNPLKPPYAINIKIGKVALNSDIDNRIKATQDFLKNQNMIVDDNIGLLWEISAKRDFENTPAKFIRVEVISLETQL